MSVCYRAGFFGVAAAGDESSEEKTASLQDEEEKQSLGMMQFQQDRKQGRHGDWSQPARSRILATERQSLFRGAAFPVGGGWESAGYGQGCRFLRQFLLPLHPSPQQLS